MSQVTVKEVGTIVKGGMQKGLERLIGQPATSLCARYHYRGILKKAGKDFLVFLQTRVVEQSGPSRGAAPTIEDILGTWMIVFYGAIECVSQPNFSLAPLSTNPNDLNEVMENLDGSIQNVQDVLKLCVGHPISVLCARYHYRGILSEVGDESLTLAQVCIVEQSGPAKGEAPSVEDAMGSSMVISYGAIECISQPNFVFAPLPSQG